MVNPLSVKKNSFANFGNIGRETKSKSPNNKESFGSERPKRITQKVSEVIDIEDEVTK